MQTVRLIISKRNSRKKKLDKRFLKKNWEGNLRNFRYRRKDVFIQLWKHEHTLSSPVLQKKQVLRGQRAFHGRLGKFLFILPFNLHQSLPKKQVFCKENHYFEKGGCILRTTGVIFACAVVKSSLLLQKR